MKRLPILSSLLVLLMLTSCNKEKIKTLENQVALKNQEIELYQQQINNLESTNGSLLDRMADLHPLCNSTYPSYYNLFL